MTRFVTVHADCDASRLAVILRDAGLPENYTDGAWASASLSPTDAAKLRRELDERGIQHD